MEPALYDRGTANTAVWLRIGPSDRLLWTRWWTFQFHKMLLFWRGNEL